jgi:phenylacetate-CoA ligase
MKLGLQIIDKIRGTEILNYYDLLKSNADTDIKQIQTHKLSSLLLEMKCYNRFYSPLLKDVSIEEITSNPTEVLKRLPIMDKKSIGNNYDYVFTRLKDRPVQRKKTGGSTGNPFYYYVDKEHLSWFWAYIYFFWHRNSGYEPGDPFITIAGNSLRTTSRQFIEKTYHLLQNNYFITGDIIDKSLKIDTRKTRKAVLLYGYPSSIINIVRSMPDMTRKTPLIKAIFTTSEQLLPSTRLAIEEAFGVPVYDMYGANDGGILTCECSNYDGYHINDRTCLVETFTNEFGLSELLLTNLSSYSFPFIRYRVGDIGRLKIEKCDCGIKSARIIDLKGRTRDMIRIPNGKSIHGSFFNNVFYKFKEIDGYRIVQNKDLSIKIHIHVINPEAFNEVAKDVFDEISSFLKDADLTIEQMDEFNPTNDKFKLIESHVV